MTSHCDPLDDGASFGKDEMAYFADDSVDPVVSRRIGASPGGIAALSPAKHMPLSRGTSTPAVPGSTKKGALRALADVTNTPISSCPKKRLFGPSLTVTPASIVGGEHQRRRETCTVATSPLPHARASEELLQDLQAENERLLKMYDFMRVRAEDTEKERAEVQSKLDGKIMEAMSLASRLDETKRLSKQLKAELRDGKARSLPSLNGALSGSAPVERKYEEMLRQQRDEFHEELERQQAHCQDLEDTLDALELAPTAVEALLSSLRERTGLQSELHEARRAKEDAEARARGLEDDLASARRNAASDKRRSRTLLANRDDLIDRLEAVIIGLQQEVNSRPSAFLHDDDCDVQTDWEEEEEEDDEAHNACRVVPPEAGQRDCVSAAADDYSDVSEVKPIADAAS